MDSSKVTERNLAFSKLALKRHWSLIPTVAITGAAVCMCGSYIAYMMLTKPDLSYTPWNFSTNAPYSSVGPTEVRKMVNMHKGKIEVDPEIVQLRKDIGSYKA